MFRLGYLLSLTERDDMITRSRGSGDQAATPAGATRCGNTRGQEGCAGRSVPQDLPGHGGVYPQHPARPSHIACSPTTRALCLERNAHNLLIWRPGILRPRSAGGVPIDGSGPLAGAPTNHGAWQSPRGGRRTAGAGSAARGIVERRGPRPTVTRLRDRGSHRVPRPAESRRRLGRSRQPAWREAGARAGG